MQNAVPAAGATELDAAVLQIAITLGLAALCAGLFRRYRKPYLGWFTVSWLLYLSRLIAIGTFLTTEDRVWLYWHQVATGWTALALLWAALVFSRSFRWRWRYLALMLFPPSWSFMAIYRLDSFLLAAMPAVLFLSAVTIGTGWVFVRHYREARSAGAALLAGALLLWGLHHLDYPFLRARGAWNPWGYYLDILFTLATGAGILVLLLDELRQGLAAMLTLSGDLQGGPDHDGLARLLERPLALPRVKGSGLYGRRAGRIVLLRGAGVCAEWPAEPAGEAETRDVAEVIAQGAPRLASAWRDPAGRGDRFAFVAVLPVFLGPENTAALLVVGEARDPFAALDQSFLVALGQQIGAALNNEELYRRVAARTAELERLSRRMIQQHERERRRLSLHLHDETAQLLTAVKLQLGLMKEEADAALQERLAHMLGLMDEGLRGIRNLTNDLRPSLLDDLGLLPALRSLAAVQAQRAGLEVAIEAPPQLPPLAPDLELVLFRALQESLTNVAEHAGARHVRVRLSADAGTVTLDVVDDGRGFPIDAMEGLERAGHLGLAGMRERVTAFGGAFEAGNAPGDGARIRVRVPVGAG